MPDLIDFARVLAPISETEPCGVDLRWDTVYDKLRKARQQRDTAAFEGEKATEPDWPFLVDEATEVLATRSKDLQIAGWLTEALLQLHGFAGVRDGVKVINGLIEKFWEHVYPRPDEGDMEPRIAPLVWLTEPDRGARMGNLLREVPLAPNPNGDANPDGKVEVYSYLYWESRSPKAGSGEQSASATAARNAEAARRAKRFDDAVAVAPRDFYIALYEALVSCQAEVAQFDAALDQRLGRDAPGTSAVRDSLAGCLDLVKRLMRSKGINLEPASGEAGADEAAPGETTMTADNGAVRTGAAGPLNSRADAFRRLKEVAEFLRRTEPQSPVPYLIERAIAWGEMPFERLLQEIVKDSSVREQVVELLGITVSEQ